MEAYLGLFSAGIQAVDDQGRHRSRFRRRHVSRIAPIWRHYAGLRQHVSVDRLRPFVGALCEFARPPTKDVRQPQSPRSVPNYDERHLPLALGCSGARRRSSAR
jgi:hypothetical protein